MSVKNSKTVDTNYNALHQNLIDLDNISQNFLSEFKQKNKVLEEGLKDCSNCEAFINKSSGKNILVKNPKDF